MAQRDKTYTVKGIPDTGSGTLRIVAQYGMHFVLNFPMRSDVV